MPDEKKFADLEFWQRCAVVGACLSESEKRKLLKKYDLRDYELGSIDTLRILVRLSVDQPQLADRIDAHLRRKYGDEGKDWFSDSPTRRIARWREALETGDPSCMLWTAVTDEDEVFSEALLSDYFAFLHHGTDLAAKRLREVERAKVKTEEAEKKHKASRSRERTVRREKQQLSKKVAELERKLKSHESRKEPDSTPESDARDREYVEALEKRLILAEEKSLVEARNVARLQSDLGSRDREIERLREVEIAASAEITKLLDLLRVRESDCKECPGRDLCNRNVLLVGGLTRLKSVYRNLVTGCGGDFRYHTGESSSTGDLLRNGVSWADIVLCPVDVNSHSAALGVKRLCRKMEKPFMMLRSSSVSSLSKALDTIAAQ
jgi:hypothetical protein